MLALTCHYNVNIPSVINHKWYQPLHTWEVGTGWGGWGVVVAGAFLGWLPSVTDFNVIPWYVPIVSILNPSVSENKITSYDDDVIQGDYCQNNYLWIFSCS